MTKPKSKPKAMARSSSRKTGQPTSRKRPAPVSSRRTVGHQTKHACVIEMLKKPAGATTAAIMAVTGWQQHSVRGFLAGVVRKKLGLNLVSDQTEKGRVYRIKEGRASPAATDRTQQAA
jgi:hypothetical protein